MRRRRLLTVDQVAERCNLSPARVYDLLRQSILPGVRFGRQVRVPSDLLEQFIRDGGRPLPGGWRRRPTNGQEVSA